MLAYANIFQPLIDVFAAVIKFFNGSLGLSWGWSIILLTICVRLVMIPLTIKQFHSMRSMQSLQPQIAALKERYKGDKQRQQQEQMKLFSQAGVNPLASCLPMVAQLPVFVSLFYMLRKNLRADICPAIQRGFQHTYALHYQAANHVTAAVAHAASLSQTTECGQVPGSGFLFIKDITDQAHGAILIVLCLLYVGTQMASSLLMSNPTMDKNQRRMMTFLPVVFVLFIIRFPAGLLIYWITTNTWTMGQQFTLKRVIGAPLIAEEVDDDVFAGSAKPSRGARTSPGRVVSTDQSPTNAQATPGRISSLFTPRTGNAKSVVDVEASVKPSKSGQAGTSSRTTTPPPSPRKKKKRSGRRR